MDVIFPHTFAIKNNVRGLPEDINSIYNILARRTDGKGDVKGHKEAEYTRWLQREGEKGTGG